MNYFTRSTHIVLVVLILPKCIIKRTEKVYILYEELLIDIKCYLKQQLALVEKSDEN